jgi:putative tryptophan/tyrosine transport system substrate-binding protein
MRPKSIVIGITVILGIAIAGYVASRGRTQRGTHIAVFSLVEIEPIAELRQGFESEMKSSQFANTHKLTFDEYNAQGDASLVNQIADKIVASNPKLAFVLGTPAAQALEKRSQQILIVQGAATDPISAGLATAWSGSGRNYLATSDLPPVDEVLQLIHQLTPKVRRIGVIFNPSESNSVAVMSRLGPSAASAGFTVVEEPISNTDDIPMALAAMLNRVDAIFLPPDNTVYSGIPAVGLFARDHSLPFYATADSAIDAGALATFSLDYVELGRESADLALEALAGKSPGSIPIAVIHNPSIQISRSVAGRLGVNLSGITLRPNERLVD